MHPILILAAAAAGPPPAPLPGDSDIVVTARESQDETGKPMVESSAPVEVTPRLSDPAGLPMATDILRLFPGVSVATSGPRGSQTQVRLRGAEANHTLLVVDGIRFNDPASGNEPRFELLSNDFAESLSLLLGARSALWGSEAIGGVVVAQTLEPGADTLGARAEYGSLDSARGSASLSAQAGKVGIAATAAGMHSDGIDSFSGAGDKDGFDNRSASAKLVFIPGDRYAAEVPIEFGLVGHWIEGRSEYDGFDPLTFRHADTADSTRNRIGALRAWAKAQTGGWTLTLDGSLLASANRNLLAGAPLNRTFGKRFTVSARASKTIGGHVLTAAAEHQAETFRARDEAFGGATRQDRSRALTAFVGEWEAKWSRRFSTDVAVRRDRFSAFGDSTTIRAGATFEPVRRVQLLARYGDGIAQPTFYDLYGFFPGAFAGNPALRPERSKEWVGGVQLGLWKRLTLGVDYFRARLEDEIVDVFDPVTFRSTAANATGASRRQGVDALLELRPHFRGVQRLFASYTYLDAEERQVAGSLAVREVRRPRHSAGFGGQGEIGRLSWGATLAYVGARRDTDFDSFPARPVRLDDYWLGSLQLGFRLTRRIDAFARAENALDADYQDAFGYRTEGRTVHAGLRLRVGP
ncbi:MAG: TonB-dependent receptor plug domain-containing protein [Allosphingosinicella sp.]